MPAKVMLVNCLSGAEQQAHAQEGRSGRQHRVRSNRVVPALEYSKPGQPGRRGDLELTNGFVMIGVPASRRGTIRALPRRTS